VIVDPAELDGVGAPEEATRRRNVETLAGYAARAAAGRSHRVVFRFLRSPVEIVGDHHGRVRRVRIVRNRLDNEGRAIPTWDEELIECGLVFRSVGYRGRPLDGIPFDEDRGVIRNEGGRVIDGRGSVCRGEYAVGWVKRGPSGVIGTNKKDAADTVKRISRTKRREYSPNPTPSRQRACSRERLAPSAGTGGLRSMRTSAPAGRPLGVRASRSSTLGSCSRSGQRRWRASRVAGATQRPARDCGKGRRSRPTRAARRRHGHDRVRRGR
jgi:NADPH-dependent glutamate synthase beta subunit-like oxidoreductase